MIPANLDFTTSTQVMISSSKIGISTRTYIPYDPASQSQKDNEIKTTLVNLVPKQN